MHESLRATLEHAERIADKTRHVNARAIRGQHDFHRFTPHAFGLTEALHDLAPRAIDDDELIAFRRDGQRVASHPA